MCYNIHWLFFNIQELKVDNIQSLSTGQDEVIFLRERKKFIERICQTARLYNVDDIYVSQLFSEEQSKVLNFYGGTLPRNMSLNNPVIDFLIWENVRLKLELQASEALAFTDALTGLSNRHVFDDELMRKVKHYDRSMFSSDSIIMDDDNFSLILFDLDNFKSVNDTFGHSVGDRVLRKVASVALEHIRSSDVLVRYGGEEFAIIVTGEIRAASLLAERIRKSIEKINVEKLGLNSSIRSNITASFGVNQYLWLGDQVTSIDMLISGADVRLYTAKNSGRNQVVSADF